MNSVIIDKSLCSREIQNPFIDFKINKAVVKKSSILYCSYRPVQLNVYLRTQLVKNNCTYCEKYSNQDMDFHSLTCEVV